MRCNPAQLRRIPLLQSLPVEVLETFAGDCESRLADRGDVLYEQGDPCEDLFLICAGTAKLSRVSGGKERILSLIGSGGIIVGGALLGEQQRSGTATLLAPGIIVVCPVDHFESFLRRHPAVALDFNRHLMRRLRDMQARLADLTSVPVRERLAGALQEFSELFGVHTEQGTFIRLPLRQYEVGQYIAATREITSLLLNEMRREHLIDFGPEGYRMERPDALEVC